MSAKIISFPGMGKGEGSKTRLVRTIRDAVRNPKLKLATSDLLGPAQYVDKLVHEARRNGIDQNMIRAALPDDGSVPPRHLERLRISHQLKLAEARNMSWGDRSRFVGRYVVAVETLAALLGRPKDDAIYEAFRNTSFMHEVGHNPDDPPVEFADLLQEMGARLAAKQPFASYFEKLGRYCGYFDPATQQFIDGERPAIARAYEGVDHFAMWYEGSPLPSIPILEVARGSWTGRLRVERNPIARQDAPRHQVAELVSWRHSASGVQDWRGVDAEVTLYTQICLAVGPLARPDDLGPVLETHSTVGVRLEGALPTQLTCDRSLTPLAALPGDGDLADYAGTVAIRASDGWHRVTGFGEQGWQSRPGSEAFQQSEENTSQRWQSGQSLGSGIGLFYDYGIYVDTLVATGRDSWRERQPEFCTIWDRVNAETIAQVTAILGDEGPRSGSFDDVKVRLLAPTAGPYLDRIPSAFRFTGRARLLEKALIAGAIEENLTRSCDRLLALLQRRLEEQREAIREADQAMLARWRRPTTSDQTE